MRREVLKRACAPCRTYQSHIGRRRIQISATPSTSDPQQSLSNGAEARMEVIGSPFSLLSASISASQNLYTRKGTLVGFNGKAENAVSTLSLLEPFRRALTGIPFLYQRVTSTTPYTALIAPKSPVTSLAVVHLDGRLDWMIAQRNALLAWTGQTLRLSPRLNTNMSLAHWGSTSVTGRGLLALSGRGLIHQVTLKTDEEYVVHPSNVIAYTIQKHAPQPYRFRANLLRFQIPSPTTLLPDTRFWRTMREHVVWRLISQTAFTIRTWARRTIWGDRLFLHFHGPTTILVQSRGSNLRDALTSENVNEIADSPAGAVPEALHIKPEGAISPPEGQTLPAAAKTSLNYATISRDGHGTVKFDREKQ
ncbi:Altered inheritance of mitochondria protein 24, mitochondrial [Teratosphaeria destructans]|uniref:Altered inheritance of mitochondria protein 24, mitochondrial n=1 Tax=Teratosphaeria destructans TaxID=418781 RepID=A0A9W7T3V4_9PEZI|nr:Altered inheritance of mitochondria protein 24, mitochondrial [Teratosphaeria destructans]